jgi:CPA2 family monovalent cation:H+ antiporter-2
VFTVAGIVVLAFQRLRIPAVVGLLVSGVIVGPDGLSLVSDVEHVHQLAEIGVVVLLFAVGLEFSPTRLMSMGRTMLQVGLPQIVLSLAGTIVATWWYFGSLRQAIFAGMLVAMSSTAVVLKILTDRGELSSPHGRIDVAVLLLQDLCVVAAVLLVPLLAAQRGAEDPAGAHAPSLWLPVAVGIATVAGILVAGRFLLPRLLLEIVRTRNRELFLITLFVVCIGTATLTARVGLSLALGAFLAGLTLSESDYGHQTFAEILPFRDTLSSLFFVSVGMLLDVGHVVSNIVLVAATVAGLLTLKTLSVAAPALATGHPLRTAILSGLALSQVGEFSFVLASAGMTHQLLDASDYQTFLAASVLTMGATPFVMNLAPRIADRLTDLPWLARWVEPRSDDHDAEAPSHRDHVIIAGYGLNGRNLACVLRELGIPYLVLETNPQTVRMHGSAGESIMFGDCTRPSLLERAGIRRARAYVVGISDPRSTCRTVQIARQLNASIRIIVRTRYQSELDELRLLGADEVIPEEFETSIEIFARVLREFQVPGNVIGRFVAQIRADNYDVFREEHLGREPLRLPVELLGQAETESWLITQGSPAVGRTIGSLAVRTRTGASVIAIRRGTQLIANPGANDALLAGDVVVFLGSREQVSAAAAILEGSQSD